MSQINEEKDKTNASKKGTKGLELFKSFPMRVDINNGLLSVEDEDEDDFDSTDDVKKIKHEIDAHKKPIEYAFPIFLDNEYKQPHEFRSALHVANLDQFENIQSNEDQGKYEQHINKHSILEDSSFLANPKYQNSLIDESQQNQAKHIRTQKTSLCTLWNKEIEISETSKEVSKNSDFTLKSLVKANKQSENIEDIFTVSNRPMITIQNKNAKSTSNTRISDPSIFSSQHMTYAEDKQQLHFSNIELQQQTNLKTKTEQLNANVSIPSILNFSHKVHLKNVEYPQKPSCLSQTNSVKLNNTSDLKPLIDKFNVSSKKAPESNLQKTSFKELNPKVPNKISELQQIEMGAFKVPNNAAASAKSIIIVNNKQYKVLSLLGKGGSCKVYQVYSPDIKNTLALKHVKLDNVEEAIRQDYRNEINILKSLQNSETVIKMYDFEYKDKEILVVLEKGDSDFNSILNKIQLKNKSDPISIKFYWMEMLKAVQNIHNHGIIHTDLKPANFLMVQGKLKLIDFGIACKLQQDATSVLKDNPTGTVNYMSPEAIQENSGGQSKFKVSFKSDVWSLGCILYKMVYGSPPFSGCAHILQQIQAIVNNDHEIPFPPIEDQNLLTVLKSCLIRDPKKRISVEDLLSHPYLISPMITTVPNMNLIINGIQQLTPRRLGTVSRILQNKMKEFKN